MLSHAAVAAVTPAAGAEAIRERCSEDSGSSSGEEQEEAEGKKGAQKEQEASTGESS